MMDCGFFTVRYVSSFLCPLHRLVSPFSGSEYLAGEQAHAGRPFNGPRRFTGTRVCNGVCAPNLPATPQADEHAPDYLCLAPDETLREQLSRLVNPVTVAPPSLMCLFPLKGGGIRRGRCAPVGR